MKLTSSKTVVQAALKENRSLVAKGVNPSRLVNPYLIGDPGLGKTSIVEQIAEEENIDLATVIVAQYDPAELSGLAYLDGDSYKRARPDWLPEDGEGILFLDELPQACTMSQNIMAQLINERRIGEHELGEGWVIVAAGNKTSNRAGTSQMPSHLKDRLMFIEVEANLDDVVKYFYANDIDERVCGYLRFRPDFLSKFDSAADACPSPRSWARASTILGWKLDAFEEIESMKGTVGDAASVDFRGYCDLYHKMPDPDKIIKDPLTGEIPEDPALLYALCAALAYRAKDENIESIISYLNRLANKEFTVFTMKDAYARNEKLATNKHFQQWLMSTGKELLI